MPEVVGQTGRENEEDSRDHQGPVSPASGERQEFVGAISRTKQDGGGDEDPMKADEGQAVRLRWRIARKWLRAFEFDARDRVRTP